MIKTALLMASLATPEAPAPLVEVDFMLPAQSVVTYPGVSELRQISAPRLSPEAQQTWDTVFLPSSYFSAFAYAKSGGYGYATSSNTPETARRIAMTECLNLNEQCRIIAEIYPQGYTEPKQGEITLSFEVAGYYQETLTLPQNRAMAVSAEGAYSYGWGYGSLQQAESEVLANCEGNRDVSAQEQDLAPCILLPGLN